MDKRDKKEKLEKEGEEQRKEKSSEEDNLENIVKQNKQIRLFFIIIGTLLILFFSIYIGTNSMSKFDYEGVKFKIVNEGKLIFYNTAFPYKSTITGKIIGDYNFYIRNDPRKLNEGVPFNGELKLMKNIVMNSEDAFNCEGDGIIAIENLRRMLEVMGATVIRDENATCDESGRYTYMLLKEGNQTDIEQIGASCYNININNCEILKATERFMVESFVELSKQKDNSLVLSFSEVE